MEIIRATEGDLPAIERITEQAKAQLRGMGLDQWQKGYPNAKTWREDIALGRAYVALCEGRVVGAFAHLFGEEEDYRVIEGAWLTHGPYASLHRVCVADGMRGQGIAPAMFEEAVRMTRAQGVPALRIDTHPDNCPMRRAIEKGGFVPCGTIRLSRGLEAGDLRLAFERIV